ncbi:MAG: hypothetical protein LBV69_03105 [Bacteroidales bacterium]|jgi:hypothetical protein|nr:hypothetical protein [Bacteroidales bacterium]
MGNKITFIWETKKGEFYNKDKKDKNFSVDWGDGEKTFHLLEELSDDIENNTSHKYKKKKNYTVVVESEDYCFLEFDICNTGLSKLDVSEYKSLKFLDCWDNQLTNLDISKNIELFFFMVY